MDLRNLDDLNFRLRLEDLAGQSEVVLSRLRVECQTNLRFLVNCVLRPASPKFISLSERCHGPLIDSFLRPVVDVPFDEWSPIKERVTLASRGLLKSTIVAGFLAQLQLCDPDIRVLIISGKLSLGKTILDTSRLPFLSNEVVRFLFPDWAITEEDVGADSFTCLRRDPSLNLRDPTLSIATFESVKAGGHFELLVFDDCTNEINCATNELVEKNEQYYDDTDPLVEPGGYRHFLGTRWAPDDVDLPEIIKRRGEVFEEEHLGQQNTSYLFIPAWTIRSGKTEEERQVIVERDRKNQLVAEDVTLAWPEKLSARVLWPKYRSSPVKYNRQYLLRYIGSMMNESFSRDVLIRSTRPYAEAIPLPHDRLIVVNWDMAGVYSGLQDRRASDFSCGFAVMFELTTKRMLVYDAMLEVFMSSTDAALGIVDFYRRQLLIGTPVSCDIEDSSGVRLLEGEILQVAKKASVPIVLRWQPKSGVQGAKAIRIAKLAGAMKRGLINFSTNLPQRDLIFRQFEKWSPQHKRVKDDAPDCAAQIWNNYSDRIYPGVVQAMMPSENTLYAPESMGESVPDPHADEREYADIGWLSQMTVPHA